MASNNLPKLTLNPGRGAHGAAEQEMPFTLVHFTGVPFKRVVAYLIDVIAIAVLMAVEWFFFQIIGVLSFGLLSPILLVMWIATPLAYHTLFIGGSSSATLGMRFMGIEVRVLNGDRPGYLLAALQTIAFYVTVGLTNVLILIVALFNSRRRCLHDYLCGTVVINSLPWPGMEADGGGHR